MINLTIIAMSIFVVLKLTVCTRIMDDIEYDKYCPANNTCDPPESHLVCKAFSKDVKKGNPICHNYEPYQVTYNDVELIIQRINKIRATVANGNERGRDGIPFPRAYGMLRMHWDSELAGLAHFLKKNCDTGSWYTCAATGRFPSPVVSGDSVPESKGVFEKILDKWENYKMITTVQHILECPDLTRGGYAGNARYYLRMIQGPATHMGCSVANCTSTRELYRLTCYFSYWTSMSAPVYMTYPPIPGAGFTPKCGCPPGYYEDDECLCEEVVQHTTSTAAYYNRLKFLNANYNYTG